MPTFTVSTNLTFNDALEIYKQKIGELNARFDELDEEALIKEFRSRVAQNHLLMAKLILEKLED